MNVYEETLDIPVIIVIQAIPTPLEIRIGESYEIFVRKRALVKYQSQSRVVKMMLSNFQTVKVRYFKLLNYEISNF